MRAAVVGGGLAGMVAAADLAAAGVDVTLFEPAPKLGGQIRTRREAGFVVEDGAEGWVASDPDLKHLCASLGISDQVVAQLELRSLLYSSGALSDLRPGSAAGLLGIQAKDSDLGRGIVSLRDGTASLVEHIERSFGGRVRIEHRRAESIVPQPGGLEIRHGSDGPTLVEGVVIATPAVMAASLVEAAVPVAAQLREVEHTSNVSVSLAWYRSSVAHSLEASGFVVDPATDLEGLRACAFSSSKLPNRAPPGRVLLRAFFRPVRGVDEGDATWAERSVQLLAPILGLSGQPLHAWVARWRGALPQPGKEHGAIMTRVAAACRALGRVVLAGAVYHPGGIPGAVRSGRAAARELLAR